MDESGKPLLDYATPPRPIAIPRYRKFLAGGMIVGGIVFIAVEAVLGTDVGNLLPGFLLVAGGVAIRYQHVRLW